MHIVLACMIYHVGMSEGCGPAAVNKIEPNKWKLGTVGRPLVGMEMKIHNPDEQGEGEVNKWMIRWISTSHA